MHPRPDGTRRFTEPATCCSFDVEKIGFHEEFFFHTFILYVREYRTHQRHPFVEHRRQNVDAASFLSLSCGMHFLVVTFFKKKKFKASAVLTLQQRRKHLLRYFCLSDGLCVIVASRQFWVEEGRTGGCYGGWHKTCG